MTRIHSILPATALALCTAAAADPPPDAVAIDPDVHHVLLDNEHVRVFEARASHGATSPMHSHPPLVFISLGTARAKLTLPDGKDVIFDMWPGQVLWMPDGMQHSWELLSGDLRVVAVEVKSAQAARAAD
jgi:quercetin dioxygenase-like cupin family protein